MGQRELSEVALVELVLESLLEPKHLHFAQLT
jgi:hypothetical protein